MRASTKRRSDMTTITFDYKEIMDVDWTATDVEIQENGKVVARYRNYDPAGLGLDDLYSNQSESFVLPSIVAARQMIESCKYYQQVSE